MKLSLIWALLARLDTTLPHGDVPWQDEDPDTEKTEAQWDAMTWNPPPGSPHTVADSGADAKPSWSDLEGERDDLVLENVKFKRKLELDGEARRRITLAYSAEDIIDEILKRLRAEQTASEDAERERLRARNRAYKAAVDAGDDVDRLEAFDPTDDTNWDASTPTPRLNSFSH